MSVGVEAGQVESIYVGECFECGVKRRTRTDEEKSGRRIEPFLYVELGTAGHKRRSRNGAFGTSLPLNPYQMEHLLKGRIR